MYIAFKLFKSISPKSTRGPNFCKYMKYFIHLGYTSAASTWPTRTCTCIDIGRVHLLIFNTDLLFFSLPNIIIIPFIGYVQWRVYKNFVREVITVVNYNYRDIYTYNARSYIMYIIYNSLCQNIKRNAREMW